MSLLILDYNTIVKNMILSLAASTGVSDFNIGSVARSFLEATAVPIDEAYFQLSAVLQGFFLNSATGPDLDKRLSDFGRQRALSQAATIGLVFTGINTPTVTAGTICTSPAFESSPSLDWITLEDGGLGTSIPAQCLTFGSVGNIPIISVGWTIQNNPDSTNILGVSNTAAATDGFDVESDDIFRARGIAYLGSLSKSTPNAILSAALNSIDQQSGAATGVTHGRMLENFKLIYPSGVDNTMTDLASATDAPTLDPLAFPASNYGNFVLVVDNGTGTLGFASITSLLPIINGDVTQPTLFPGYRAAGVQAFVTRPQIVTENIELGIVVDTTLVVDATDVINACITAISQFIVQLPIGGTLYRADLVQLCIDTPGVINVPFIHIVQPVGDVPSAPATKLVPGTITINII